MYLKKILIFIFICLSLTFFISCETTTVNQKNTISYNKPHDTDNKNKSSETISSELIKNEVLNIGLMLPLSGKHYRIGKSLLNSSQLALEKTNTKNIVFHIADTGNEDQIINNLYNILDKDIQLIIGPVFTDSVIKIRDIVKQERIPMITLSNNSKLEEKGIYVFNLTLEDEVEKLLRYSFDKKLRKFAVIAPKNEYGKRIKDQISKFESKNTPLYFKYVFYETQTPDFYKISKTISNYEERKLNLENKIKILEYDKSEKAEKELKILRKIDTYGELDFNALLIFTESFDDLSNLSSILPYYDVDPKKVQYIGNSMWAKNLSLKEPGLENSYFTALDIKSRKQFEEVYLNIFRMKPHSLATLSYDLIGLLSRLHSEKNRFKIEKLYSDVGFIGIDGWFKIIENGKVLRDPNIYRIKNQNFIPLN